MSLARKAERAKHFASFARKLVATTRMGKFVVLYCNRCGKRHVDHGTWRTIPHRTHLCEHCGHKWQPREFNTVGA